VPANPQNSWGRSGCLSLWRRGNPSSFLILCKGVGNALLHNGFAALATRSSERECWLDSRSGERGSLSACGTTHCETLFSENGKAPDSEGYRLAQSLMEK